MPLPNAVKLLVDNPCDAPWVVYAETFLPAFGNAVLQLVSFGMDDVVRGAFRPRDKRSLMHRRKGKKGRKLRPRIPEFGNMIGSKIMVEKSFVTREVAQGVKHLWVLDGVIQKGLWYWLIYDVIGDGLYQWSSLIMQSEFCQAKASERLHANGFGGGLLGILDWQALLCPTILYKTNGINWNVSTGSIPAGTYQLIVANSSVNTGPSNNIIQIGIFDDPLFNFPLDVSEPQIAEPGFKMKMVASARVEGPGTFTIGWRNNQGATTGIWAGVFVMQIGV